MFLSDYDYARLKALIEKQRESPRADPVLLARLEARIAGAKVVPPEYVPDTSVSINSQVRFKNLSTREQSEYTLVFPGEADIEKGKVSILSPIGAALIGASVGDVVEFAAPVGVRRLRIEQILFQPEAAGYFYV